MKWENKHETKLSEDENITLFRRNLKIIIFLAVINLILNISILYRLLIK
jgi:hypothetical protein